MIVFAERGDDDKKIDKASANQRGNVISALRQTRSGNSETRSLTTPTSQQWCPLALFLRHHRRLKWHTSRLMTTGAKRQRRALRRRHTVGSRRDVGKVHLGCSEATKRPAGRRTDCAGHAVNATARPSVWGYRLRWAVALFPKDVTMHLGFEDVATSEFAAVRSHVHWG